MVGGGSLLKRFMNFDKIRQISEFVTMYYIKFCPKVFHGPRIQNR